MCGTEVGLLKNNLPVLQNPLSFGDYDDVDHDILRKPDRRPEVSSKSHQQVQDGNDVLGVDRLDTPLVHSTVGPLKFQSKSFVKRSFLTVTTFVFSGLLHYLVDAQNFVGKTQNSSELCSLSLF